ncbi:MAG: SPOR domain-containing protein, partial [Rhodospirillaceae bacterium]|nr:SPOR domain-containing protein [Rhodospirillaceae bacterium]
IKISAAIFAVISLGACSALNEGAFGNNVFWANGPVAQNDLAELGLAELTKGDSVKALGFFERALAINPDDVHALFGSALVYQNTGQSRKARAFYERIKAIQPQPTEEIVLWTGSQPQSIDELASINLAIMGGGSTDVVASGQGSQMSSSVPTRTPTVGGAMPTSQLYVTPSAPSMAVNRVIADEITFSDADKNIVERFRAMRQLVEQGLITTDEFTTRRQVNIGSLLPLSSNPPSTGLDRPVPPVGQITNRLRAISRALEMRAISVSQHSSERTMILDALMPESPASMAMPPLPPKDLMSAADAIRRLEFLKQADIITNDEYARERSAIEGAMNAQMASSPQSAGQMSGTKTSANGKPSAKKLSGFQPGVHLASYRQMKAAERGWKQLQAKFPSQLGDLEMNIEQVDLGSPKGVFYRLKAGPVSSDKEAVSVCRNLKQKRQYCDPTTINFN